jgi:hypothetical protein
LIKTGQKIPEFRFSFSLSGGSNSSSLSILVLIFLFVFAAAKGMVIITLLSQMGLSIWASFGHVWAILHLGGKPNPTNLPLPD